MILESNFPPSSLSPSELWSGCSVWNDELPSDNEDKVHASYSNPAHGFDNADDFKSDDQETLTASASRNGHPLSFLERYGPKALFKRQAPREPDADVDSAPGRLHEHLFVTPPPAASAIIPAENQETSPADALQGPPTSYDPGNTSHHPDRPELPTGTSISNSVATPPELRLPWLLFVVLKPVLLLHKAIGYLMPILQIIITFSIVALVGTNLVVWSTDVRVTITIPLCDAERLNGSITTSLCLLVPAVQLKNHVTALLGTQNGTPVANRDGSQAPASALMAIWRGGSGVTVSVSHRVRPSGGGGIMGMVKNWAGGYESASAAVASAFQFAHLCFSAYKAFELTWNFASFARHLLRIPHQ